MKNKFRCYSVRIIGIVRSMYMMNLDEDVSSDEKMNTTDDGNLDISKGDNQTIDFTYRGAHIRYNITKLFY